MTNLQLIYKFRQQTLNHSLSSLGNQRFLSIFSSYISSPKVIQPESLRSISLKPKQDSMVANSWNYPSDHLPHIAEVYGIRVGTFNILNPAYVHHVERECWKNSHFMIEEGKKSKTYEELSNREEESYHSIRALMLNGSRSLDILCIQECSDKMFLFLKNEFSKEKSSNQIQLFMLDGGMKNHAVMLVKPSSSLKVTSAFGRAFWSRKFVPPETKTEENPQGTLHFGLDIWRPASIVEIEKTTPRGRVENIVTVGVHVSCAGEKEDYRLERANELFDRVNNFLPSDKTLILLGDFNMPESVIQQSKLKDLHDLTTHHCHVDAKVPEIMAIDRIFTKTPKGNQTFCGALALEDGPDARAAEVYANALKPFTRFK